ncbi:helix-turn-helix transcriptional regulator [Georgenia sp. H159]|uniref:helix-turn-helix transcriptional regulator n=1 Tax=Georgenia sp. H159 TaxID=3076115 RepID=UPI002D77CB3C|nr:LuxR C-terminal-related transcriptional regulator [Georgenia sp. H159]
MEHSTGSPGARVVGRAAERGRVEEFVTRLPVEPRSLVVVGDAGIGKTTLWSYGADLARAAGHQVLTARPAEDDWPTPGLGLGDLVGATISTVPWDGLPPEQPADAARLFLEHVRTLSAVRPVVLAVDDIQWLDDLTLRLVRHVLRRLGGHPVALLATARTWGQAGAQLPPRHALTDAEVLQLGPLTVPELRDVLHADGARLTRPDVCRIHEVAGGNPMFAIELGRYWQHGEQQAVRRTPLALLTEQVESLPAAGRAVVETVALAGPSPLSLVSAVLGVDDLLDHLTGPVAALVEVSDSYVLRCAHPLVASATRAAIAPATRRLLHARLADLVEDPVERARHLARGLTRTSEEAAATLEVAARLAARRGSAATAAELAAHSIRLTPSRAHHRAVPRRLAEVTFRAAAGQMALAVALADDLLADLPPGPEHARVLAQRVLLDFGGAEDYLRRALADVGDDDGLRGVLLDLLGWQLGLFKGRVHPAITHCEEALAIARARRDDEAVARAAATLSTVSLLAGVPRRELMAEAELLSRSGSSQPLGTLLRVWPGVFRARQALWDGDLPVARAGLEHASQVAQTLGSEFQRPYRLRDLAMLELAAGRLDRARLLVRDGLEAAADAGNDQATVWLSHPAGMLAALRGERSDALWAAERLEWWAARVDEPLRLATAAEVRGLLAATEGDWAAALEHHRRGVSRLDELGIVHPGFLPVLPRAVEAACMVGDAEQTGLLAGALRARAEQVRAPWVDATLQLARGQALLVAGEPGEAADVLLDARARFSVLGYVLDARRSLYFSAMARLRSGHRTAARDDLEHCRDAFTAAGVLGWARLTDESLRRLTARRGSELTPTEQRIAERVHAGLRNREIAAELFVSDSTVEAHLTRIYRKLGVRGRQDLATWSARRAGGTG